MKYECESCHGVFDEEDAGTHKEYHSEVHDSEYWACCPFCGCDDLIEHEEINKEEQFEICIKFLEQLAKDLRSGKFDKAPDYYVKHTASGVVDVKSFLVQLVEELDNE